MTARTRTALITGSSNGIGLATAIAMARAGFRTFATMRSLERRGRLDAAAAEAGVRLEVTQLDVTDEDSVSKAVADAERRGEGVDVLVNNAGVGFLGALEETAPDEIRAVFDTNFFGVYSVTRAVIPGMRARRSGTIVNVSSLGGTVALAGLGAYAASKFAVEGYSDALRRELSAFGIAVSVIQPGAIRTDMVGPEHRVARAAREPGSPYRATTEFLERMMDTVYQQGNGQTPERVADAIVAIAQSRRPPVRRRVGPDARALTLLDAILPARAVDWLANRSFERANAGARPRLPKTV